MSPLAVALAPLAMGDELTRLDDQPDDAPPIDLEQRGRR